MSLLTKTEKKVALLKQVCDEHLKRVLEFRIAVLVTELYFCEIQERRLNKFLLGSFITRAKKTLVDAMMPRIEKNFNHSFFCADDWEAKISHLIYERQTTSKFVITLPHLAILMRTIAEITANIWDSDESSSDDNNSDD